jgi:hypothetical protein
MQARQRCQATFRAKVHLANGNLRRKVTMVCSVQVHLKLRHISLVYPKPTFVSWQVH